MLRKNLTLILLALFCAIFILTGCSRTGVTTADNSNSVAETSPISDDGDSETAVSRPAGWEEASHSKEADPDYETVFPQDEVNTMTITIDPDNWQAMLDNMTELYGEAGAGGGRGFGGGRPAGGPPPAGGQPPNGEPPADRQPPAEGQPPADRQPPAGGGPAFGGGAANFGVAENPMWAEATIEFEGGIWTNVGVRFKGNSSLMQAWNSGSFELPLKLDFDEFEDTYPEIDNQRFYGFKQLSLSNNFSDNSYLRDAVSYDVMRNAGILAPETAWYEIFIDYGEGTVSLGIYTVIEVIDDTVIETALGDDSGNIYEADGTGVTLAEGTFDQISSSFLKENNSSEADWSDIEALYNVLHSDIRLADPAAWQTELESIFDVDTFLKWLAINSVIQNWDTYGVMTHNFYLYHNPDTDLLTWIPWDYNEALQDGKRGNMTLDLDTIGNDWPLISYLLDQPDYAATYESYVEQTITDYFNADKMAETYAQYAELLAPYAAADVGTQAFETAIEQLINHAYDRTQAVERFLTS
jgi:spore coat protein CotH